MMKGVTIMTDEQSGRRIAQLDLTHLSRKRTEVEDLIDILIAEACKSEKDFSWESIKRI